MRRRFAKSNEFFKKVNKVIPLASQTFSKSYLQFIKGQAPLFLTHGRGARVWDIDGNEYIDFINSQLSVVLGYNYPAVNKAIIQQIKKGINFSLATDLEYELASLIIKHIPGAEMVRFGKNGSDVTTGAVRLARAVTKRDYIAVCGYHGWHDWYIGLTPRHLGVPQSTRKMTYSFIYNDIDSLKKLLEKYKNKFAAVIMEPMNYFEPKNNFLKKVKELTHRHGALLIYDEVITGFRYSLGGAQKFFGVIPDLACFGKSMANGMPVSALVGKAKHMKRINDVFYSFTFGGETLSLAAAIATIKEMETKDVLGRIWRLGKYLQDRVNLLLIKHKLDKIIKLTGKPCWQVFFIAKTPDYSDLEIKSYLQQELLQAGFLWYGQHNMSYSHTQKDLDNLLEAYDKIFAKLKKLLNQHKLKENLKGQPISNIFKLR